MATPSSNDQNPDPPGEAGENDAPLDLYELALQQEREEKARDKVHKKRAAWKWVFGGTSCFIAVVAMLFTYVERKYEALFPSWDKSSIFKWPEGVQVQVEEHFETGIDVDYYSCSFSQSGKQIFPRFEAFEAREPLTIKHGRSAGMPYFLSQEFVGIYRPTPSNSSAWMTWSTDDHSLTSWTDQYYLARRKLRKKRKEEEFFQDANYKIARFGVKGRNWIIGLHDADYLATKENGWDTGDWYGGMPADLHVESRDFGAHWKVKEPVVIPDWLDEIHRK